MKLSDADSATSESKGESPAATIEFSQQDNGWDSEESLEEGIVESQRLLQQIIEENNRGAASAFADSAMLSGDEQSTALNDQDDDYDSQSVGSQDDSSDDKDMIVVSRKDEIVGSGKVKSSTDSIPFPTTAVSTGKAERMDYQQLFDQLRNMSTD